MLLIWIKPFLPIFVVQKMNSLFQIVKGVYKRDDVRWTSVDTDINS